MRTKTVIRILSLLWIGLSCALLLYLLSDFLNGEGANSFLVINVFTVLVILGIGIFLRRTTGRVQTQEISSRSAVASVLLVWSSITITGAIPYLWESVPLVDALFESASGFSTTGASIFKDIEALPPALLFWRSLTQWIGGMGIIVLFVAIFPSLGVSGKRLFSNEMPGPIKESLTPQLKDTTRYLWLIYVSLTFLLTIILMSLGLSGFDAINHAFATLSTGGFSTKNISIAAFSPSVHWVIALFMLLGGLNFTLYILLLKKRFTLVWKNVELRWYLSFIFAISITTAISLILTRSYSIGESLRAAFFTVISLTTTTGYVTVDYSLFAPFLQALLFATFFTGGSAGSTSGGMKFYRIVLFFHALSIEIKKSISPRSISTLIIGGTPIRHDLMSKIFIFICVYSLSVGIVALLLMGSGLEFLEAASAAASSIGNIGPAFGELGPANNYSELPAFAKIVCMFAMIVGRLEFFAFLAALHPDFWKPQTP